MRYQFKRQDALDFAAHIGQRTKIRGEEMQVCYCPYCKGGRNRDDYTFSINLKTGLFKCLRLYESPADPVSGNDDPPQDSTSMSKLKFPFVV